MIRGMIQPYIERLFIPRIQYSSSGLTLMSIKYEQEMPDNNRTHKVYLCQTCKNLGFILGTDEINYTEKMFIEECPECNS
jgi:hypothetical protein